MTSDKPLADVWTSRDFPVLVEVTRRIDAGERIVAVQDVAEALDMPQDDVERAGLALATRGFLAVVGTAQRRVRHMKDLSGEAYLLTGLPPTATTPSAGSSAPSNRLSTGLPTLRSAAGSAASPTVSRTHPARSWARSSPRPSAPAWDSADPS